MVSPDGYTSSANSASQLLLARCLPRDRWKLIAEGVEYYYVDYTCLQFRLHGTGGGVVVVALPLGDLPPVAPLFDKETLRAAIVDSQQNGQKFKNFSRRAVEAGVAGYFAFLSGKRVTYFGRQGDQHVEWFLGAKPAEA